MPEKLDEKELTEYKVGDSIFGNKIAKIIDLSPKVIVFLNENNVVGYLYKDLNVTATTIVSRYKTVFNKIPIGIPEKQSRKIRVELGSALFGALNSENDEQAVSCLSAIEKKILQIRTPNEIRTIFILWSLAVCVLSILVLGGTYVALDSSVTNWSVVLVSAASGAVGSLFSILQRKKSNAIDLTVRDLYIFMQAISHIAFGVFSGAILFAAIKANLAFGFAQDNIYAIVTLSVVSGFSERFIPEMFKNVTNTANEQDKS